MLSCPVDAVNPIAKISPKKKEKNAKVKTSEISLVYFYLKIDRKFPFFFGRKDKCHRKRRNGIGSQQLWKLLATFFPFFREKQTGLGWCALLSGSVCCARRLACSIYRKIRKIVLEDASPSPRSKQCAESPTKRPTRGTQAISLNESSTWDLFFHFSRSSRHGHLRLALAASLRHRLNWVKGVGAHFPSLIELFRKLALPFFTGSELVF
ncbi:hypothetical protein QVD17_19716 [Tagetes erecta]|uniref:Uncharacterized protein n=1 Tax=Tagetes erecta TaxID=13708 RepID=A0AAD8KK35_TARER|nr:hypothetical protein QVD17_19716 [Tagetes erecta]